MTSHGGPSGLDISGGDIQELAGSRYARACDVQEDPNAVWRRPRDLHERVNVVCAGGSAVDHRRDAVPEKHRRRQVRRGDVNVEIDQSWRDDLSARVDDI